MDKLKILDGVKVRIGIDRSVIIEAESMHKVREYVLLNFNYISPPIIKELKRKIKAIVDHHDKECNDEFLENYPQLIELMIFLDGWVEK